MTEATKSMRVQKFLAHQGVASRRAIEAMIAKGRVAINGVVVKEQGTKVDPEKDEVTVDGTIIRALDPLVYIWLNKPVGVVSTTRDDFGAETVVDLVNSPTRLYPVGRLDKDSQGLMLLTNDGELTHKLIHPRYHIDKTYHVLVTGTVTPTKLKQLRSGIMLEEGMTLPAKVTVLTKDPQQTLLQFILTEGKHRQIRRMCMSVRLHVVELTRVQFGPISLGSLKPRHHRHATASEVRLLKTATLR